MSKQIQQQGTTLRLIEITRFARKFTNWLGTELRIRHEAALRRRTRNIRLRSANPTPV